MKYEEAKVLQQQVKRRKECNCLLEELRPQREKLLPIVGELEKSNQKEQSYIKKLQGTTITSVFYSLIGKKEEKLNEKWKEASVMKAKYATAERELRNLEAEIQKAEEELSQIIDCEKQLDTYIEECYALLRSGKVAGFSEITILEQESVMLENKLLTVQETIALGKDLEWDVHNILVILGIVESIKTAMRELRVGSAGNLYEYIDKAQTAVVKLQDKLVVFRKKLHELSIDTEIEVDVDAFMHVLDVPTLATLDYMSMLFAIVDRVAIVSENFRPIEKQLGETMQKLYALEAEVRQSILDTRDELQNRIIEFASVK